MDIKNEKPLTKTELQSVIGGKKAPFSLGIPYFLKGLSIRLTLPKKK